MSASSPGPASAPAAPSPFFMPASAPAAPSPFLMPASAPAAPSPVLGRRPWLVGALGSAGALVSPPAAAAWVVDRAVVRFTAPELGGARAPRFILERELAFEARVEGLVEGDRGADVRPTLRARHRRAAVERHVAETLLSEARIDPTPGAATLKRETDRARAMLELRVGREALRRALDAEGLGEGELHRLVRRQARAALYLDRMVTPMLAPSEAELRSVHRTQPTPFRSRPYAEVAEAMRHWTVSRRLADAVGRWFQGARGRVRIVVLTGG